jgi:nucleoside-diphosphate-sugar epimerase
VSVKIVVTGSCGKLGAAVVAYARAQGTEVRGVDVVASAGGCVDLRADLTDLGQVYDALHGADAVIHLAAVPRAGQFTAAHTLLQNISSAYNVLLAAHHLGIRRVVVASSIQVMHRAGYYIRARFQYFPLDEAHPPDPKDEYGLSKLMTEQAAEMFARHYGMTIVSLRYVWICSPDEWRNLPHPPPPEDAVDPLPFCVHVEDAARATWLAATANLPLATHIPAFIAAPDVRFTMTTMAFLRCFYPDVPVRAELSGYTAPISIARAREAFGFVPHYACHDSQ